MAEELTLDENEFLNCWFPDLDIKSYIIPVRHYEHIHTDFINIADVPTAVLKDRDDCRVDTAQEIKEWDDTHKTVHALFSKLKDNTAAREVMVMMTQASFSMYSSIVTAAGVAGNRSENREAKLEDIKYQKQKHSDLIVVSKQRGILLGILHNAHFSDPIAAQNKLKCSVTYLTEAARIIQDSAGTVPGAGNVAIHTTLILTQIVRTQLEGQLKEIVQGMPCLCKDEMITDDGVKRWWETCFFSGHLDCMDSDIYRHLVARFAIPATRVEIYLTTQPRLQLKHEHDVVDVVGDVYSTEVFQAGLHQLSLFPTQAKLLDYDFLDDSADDVKFLWGPPGTGKTVLLVLRALQWVKHFSARHIVILQTSQDGTAASCLVEYQLQQTLNAQQQRAQQSSTDIQSAQRTFTHVDMSEHLMTIEKKAAGKHEKVLLKEGLKDKLYMAMGMQQRGQSDTAIHILADEADGNVVAALYKWLKDEGVTTIRLWAAGVDSFRDKKNIPDSLHHAICHVTEPLRCPEPVAKEVVRATQIRKGIVPMYDMAWQLTGGPSVKRLQHYWGRDGHTAGRTWNCDLCIEKIAGILKSLHVGEADEGRHGLSANDVFILGSEMYFDNDAYSPSKLMKGLENNGYNIRTLSSKSSRDEVLSAVKRDVKPPAIIVADERSVWGLERKIVIYCESGNVFDLNANLSGRLRAFSRSSSKLIYIESVRSSHAV